MKQIIIVFIALISAFIISCGQKTQSNKADNSSHTMHSPASSEIIYLMHAPMMEQDFQKTENIDEDFLVNMIPHHKGAILSSKKLLETTKNEKLIELANNIIMEQEKEVDEFTQLADELKNKAVMYAEEDTAALGNEMQLIMNKMMDDMSAIKTAGDNDIDFLKGMIAHHQAAVDSSKKILEHTKDEKIKEIANRIISSQEKEIAYMNNMINSL
ncbi:DUF305 domain-containing protein [uncultured Brachyspira sp.]|uniref:DUF305 domain-containing protein n=1 Tax=uncultured Brachyspira sp. TaxID=221953 RepID=UPI0025D4F880|nr:DUF305 domain-containing protein [uncultured Brachyspira sp.]